MKDQGRPGLLSRVILPWPTIAAAAASFLVCCLAGRLTRERNCYEDFQRFHDHISYLTLHYPTVSKVRAAARSRLDRDRIAVVVGGNSVLLQPHCDRKDVWTARLQELLGDEYRVVNLAACGATPAEFGATAAEVLCRDYPRLVFITNTWPGPFCRPDPTPDGRPAFRYFFWEAYRKGWLEPHAPREEALRLLARERRDEATPELIARLRLDADLGFRDLWTALEYNHFSTVWCRNLAPCWIQPRKRYADYATLSPPPPAVLEAASAGEVARLRFHLAGHKHLLQAPPTTGPGGRIEYGPGALEQSVNECFPPELRKRMLMVVCDPNPFYLNQLTPRERADYYALSAGTVERLRGVGVAALEVGEGYPVEAYYDNVHMTREGARRMADAVAPRVRELAGRLGYDAGHDGAEPLAAGPPCSFRGAGR